MRPRDWLVIPFLAATAIGGLLWGGHVTYVTLRNLEATQLTCAEYVVDPGAAEWVSLRECDAMLEVVGTVRRAPTQPNGVPGTASDVYIALRPRGSSAGAPAKLVLHVHDGPLLALGEHFAPGDVVEYADRELADRIDGLVERFRGERYRDKIRETGLSLDPSFTVIAYGERPTPVWLALGVTALGLGALGLLVRRYRRWRRRRPVPLAKATVVSEG